MSAPSFDVQIQHAHEIDSEELDRHALVSIRNHCTCRECFCCAALHVLNFRERAGVNNPLWNNEPATRRLVLHDRKTEREEAKLYGNP